jgi:hypothetical protein
MPQDESGIPCKDPSLSLVEAVRQSPDLFKATASRRCSNKVRSPIITCSLGSGSYSSLGLVTRWRTTRRSQNESGIPCKDPSLSSVEAVRQSPDLFKATTSRPYANKVRSSIITRSLGSGSYSSLGLVKTFVTTPCNCSSALAAASPNLVTSLVSAACCFHEKIEYVEFTVLLVRPGRLASVVSFRSSRATILDDGASLGRGDDGDR